MKELLKALLTGTLLAAAILGPGPAEASGSVIHRGNGAEPDTLDPQLALTWQDWNILLDTFVGLTTLDASGGTIAGLASSWSASPDGLSYEFILKTGIQWSDGEPITAEDFVYSFRRLLDPETAASRITEFYAFKNGEAINAGRMPPDALGVRAAKPDTLVIELDWPVPHLPSLLAWGNAYPVPKHAIEQHGREWTRAGISNGPYVLSEWRPYEHVHLVRNPRYFDAESVAIDEVYYYPTDDGATSFKQFRAGQLDINYGIVPSQLPVAKRELAQEMVLFERPTTMYLVFNLKRPPFHDRRVRKALSMAVDRNVFGSVLGSGERGAYDLVAPGVVDYGPPLEPDWADWTLQERRARAVQLLREAGFDRGSPLELTLRYDGSGSNRRLSLATAGMWREIGVDTKLLSTDTKIHFADIKAGNFDVARIGLSGRTYSAETFLQVFEHESPRMNPGRFRSEPYNRLMAQARRETDAAARGGHLRAAGKLLLDEYPFVALYYYVSRNLVQQYVKGYSPNPYDVHPTRFLSIQK